MGFDADTSLRGVFFNEIIASRSLFEGLDSKILKYFVTSLLERSEIAKFLRKLGKSLTS